MAGPGLREAVMAAEKAGKADEAVRLFDAAIATSPGDAGLVNNAAGSALRMGDAVRAETLYRRAHEMVPQDAEFALNLAIAHGRAGHHREAVALLKRFERACSAQPRYWSVRAGAERDAGLLALAAVSYDRCLALEPGHARALHGRARVALERDEADAAERYAGAIAASPGDAMLWLGRAQALEAAGQAAEAREIADALSAQMPGWTDAHRYLAELRLNMGDGEAGSTVFADHYGAALAKVPENPQLYVAWGQTLAGADRFAAASEVAARGLAMHPGDADLRLAAATFASAAGDLERAEGLFAALPVRTVIRRVEEARHALRRGDPERAEGLLATALVDDPQDVAAWALRGLAWRMLGDAREEWLHGQEGLVQLLPLDLPAPELANAIAFLETLHDRSFHPIGQSVRGGSQTRGALFQRIEPEIAALHGAIVGAIERYRSALPPLDMTHPLLRHRDAELAISGSWSVRLEAGGRHSVHIHPKGLLSSALYLRLPPVDAADQQGGWLELGGAPPEMGIGLPPRVRIEPREGHLALFPSTLFHGTRPFTRQRRMTVAFDVTRAA